MYELNDRPDPMPGIMNTGELDPGETAADAEADLLNTESLGTYSDEPVTWDPADIPEGEFGTPGLPPPGTVSERPMPLRTAAYGVRINPDQTIEYIDVPPDVTTGEIARLQAIKQKIQKVAELDRHGMDIEGVDQFLRQLGILATDSSVEISDEQRPTIMNILGRKGAQPGGTYVNDIDTAFTFRSTRLEALNGPQLADVTRLHELVHSGGAYERRFVLEGERRMLRDVHSGYVFMRHDGSILNRFIGEGVPEYLAGKYTVENLDLPGGLARLKPIPFKEKFQHSGSTLVVPPQYVRFDKSGALSLNAAGYAGAAIGHLIDRDPALLPAFVHGIHDSEAHKEVIGRLNAISPSLYTTLRNNFNEYSKPRFKIGAAYVCGILGIG